MIARTTRVSSLPVKLRCNVTYARKVRRITQAGASKIISITLGAAIAHTRTGGIGVSLSRRAIAGFRLDVHLQRCNERFLRNVDLAELPHAFFAFLLLLQQFALARRVAAVTLCSDVLAKSAHSLARDDLAADRGLDRHLEHVRRNQLLQLFRHGASAAF